MAKSQPLPFLDTTVVRSLLTGTEAYREFLRGELGERLYVGRFVDMEFKRGVLLTLIDFLNTLAMRHMRTIEDAERAWANRFRTRQVKLILALSASIFDKYKLDRTNPRDKERGITALAVVIKSLDREMRSRFKRLGDRTHCACGEKPLYVSVSPPERAEQELNAYSDSFKDAATNERACHMRRFFEHFQRDLTACVRHVEALPSLKKHRQLKKMAAETKKVQEGLSNCSCETCKRLGDIVIAVGAPRDMRLETTDQSFPYWCKPIKQPHRVHKSETRYLADLVAGMTTS